MSIKQQLLQIFQTDQIKTNHSDLISYSSDAGFSYLLPKAIVQPKNENEIISVSFTYLQV